MSKKRVKRKEEEREKRGKEKVRKTGCRQKRVAVGHRLAARDCQCCRPSGVTTAVLLFSYRYFISALKHTLICS